MLFNSAIIKEDARFNLAPGPPATRVRRDNSTSLRTDRSFGRPKRRYDLHRYVRASMVDDLRLSGIRWIIGFQFVTRERACDQR